MTLKILCYQARGIKTKGVVDEFEFCCWESLAKWLREFSELNKCPKCKKKVDK